MLCMDGTERQSEMKREYQCNSEQNAYTTPVGHRIHKNETRLKKTSINNTDVINRMTEQNHSKNNKIWCRTVQETINFFSSLSFFLCTHAMRAMHESLSNNRDIAAEKGKK